MIKIEIKDLDDRRIIKKVHWNYFLKKKLHIILDNKIKKYLSREFHEDDFYNFLKFLRGNLKKILTGSPKKIEKLRKTIINEFPEIHENFVELAFSRNERDVEQKYKILKEEIERIFNYNQFIKSSTAVDTRFYNNLPENTFKAPEAVNFIKIIKKSKAINLARTTKNDIDKVNEMNIVRIPTQFTRKWGAYALVKSLQVEVCPYCQRNFTSILMVEDGKTRPQLDHFISKSVYPYFALSLNNLIPCCSICNSSFKGNKQFNITSHIHPYIHHYRKCAYFSLEAINNPKNGVTDILTGEYNITIKYKKGISKSLKRKIKRNINAFKIIELYNYNTAYIDELIRQKKIYTKEFLSEIASLEIFKGDSDIRRILLGQKMINETYDFQETDNSKILNKLIEDVSQELKI